MRYYAVIDTNVVVSALIAKNLNSPPRLILRAVLTGDIIPLYHKDILEEYEEVLCRPKFHLNLDVVHMVLDAIQQSGIEVNPKSTGEILADMDDLIFYEVVMEKREDDAYLVSGNIKHYPRKDYIVTLSEMLEILKNN